MELTGLPWEVASTASCEHWLLMGRIFSWAARSQWLEESTRPISRSGTEPTGQRWAAGSQGRQWTRWQPMAAMSMPEGDLPVQEELLQRTLQGGTGKIGLHWGEAFGFTTGSVAKMPLYGRSQ